MALVVDVPALLERLGIQAKRRGRSWWACCPFHEERTPSFRVHDDAEDSKHGWWQCLGKCHEGGGSTGLVMRMLGLERASEARAWMRSGLAYDRPSAGHLAAAGGGLELGAAHKPRVGFKLPELVQFLPFEDWPSAAREHAEKLRGLDAEQVDRWGLGIAKDGRLRGRIVMPWRDSSGRVGGYTARSFIPGEPKKYLEPNADELAGAGWVYGEEHWPAERRKIVVVEGGFDGFAVERATGLPFGAAKGSNLVNGHVLRFGTWDELVLLVDPDGAGERFAEAIIGKLGQHKKITRVTLQAGYDANKFERKYGARLLAKAIAEAEPV